VRSLPEIFASWTLDKDMSEDAWRLMSGPRQSQMAASDR